jgi:hypothetical protein
MDPDAAAALVDTAVERALCRLRSDPIDVCVARRYEKFRRMGRLGQAFVDESAGG